MSDDVVHTNNGNSDGWFSKKRYYLLIIGLVIIGGLIVWAKYTFSGDVTQTVNQIAVNQVEIAKNVSSNTFAINQTRQDLNQTDHKLGIGLENQKVIAKGINDLGATVIEEIRNNTNLIGDIKFKVDEVLNTTSAIKNITIPG